MLDSWVAFILPDVIQDRTWRDAPAPDRPINIHRTWETRDGHVVMMIVEDRQFHGVCRALDRDDPEGESAVEREVFVLADTTFGACCVDEVAAAHRDADAIVHFGRACCSPTSRTPARLVFDRRAMDVERCVRAIRAHATRLGAIEGEGEQRGVEER